MKFISKLCFHILKPPTRSVLFKFEETLDFDHPMTREPRIFGKRRGTFWGAEPGWKTLVKPGWKAPTTLDEIGIWGPYIQYNIVQLCGDIVYSMYIVYLSIFIYISVTAPPKVQSVPKQTILSVMIESMTWGTNPTVFGLTLLRGLNTSQTYLWIHGRQSNTAGNSSY